MATNFGDKAARSSADVVRDWLDYGSPAGVRLGSPQTADGLTLIPIFHAGPELDYITLADAQKQGSLQVTELDEGGAVSALVVENGSNLPVLMIDGEILIGLKQNRVLNTKRPSTFRLPAWRRVAGAGRPPGPRGLTTRCHRRFAR